MKAVILISYKVSHRDLSKVSKSDHMTMRISLPVDPRVMSTEYSKRDQLWVSDYDLLQNFRIAFF
jgi:hypothetical protein